MELRAIIEPLIVTLPYSDLIALAGTSKQIRTWITQSAKWQNILSLWRRPISTLKMIDAGFDIENGKYFESYRVPRRGPNFERVSFYVRFVEPSSGTEFSLSDVRIMHTIFFKPPDGEGLIPKEIFI